MKKLMFTLFLLVSQLAYVCAQQAPAVLYKGTIGTMPVTLYLKTLPNECGGPDTYMAMYRYDSRQAWLQLDVSTNEKSDWCFVEIGFTGVMILKRTGNTLTGLWISPDGKRQLKAHMKQQLFSAPQAQKMEEQLEVLQHENFDC